MYWTVCSSSKYRLKKPREEIVKCAILSFTSIFSKLQAIFQRHKISEKNVFNESCIVDYKIYYKLVYINTFVQVLVWAETFVGS